MKLKFSSYTILIIVVSVDCGLVKNFFGNVKEDVHTAVDNTVNIIGKGTHKITEGLGVFLHRNEGSKFSGQAETVRPNNQISNDDKTDNTNELTDHKHEENTNAGINVNNSQYKPAQYTPATVEHTTVHGNVHEAQNGAHNEPTSESYINKNQKQQETTTNKAERPETTTNKNIYEHVTKSTATTVAAITETDPWSNGVELENILPNIQHNDTHFAGNKSTGNANTGSYTDTNELGTGDNLTNNVTNKKAKCDETKNPIESQNNGNKTNLISDQMFFKDNKPKPTEVTRYICAKGLVRAANGDCLEPIEIDVREKNESRAFAIIQANECASGYERAQDDSCQKIVG